MSTETVFSVPVECQSCEEFYHINMTFDQLTAWTSREDFIQNIFPDLDVDMRELLISGVCGSCFDKLMSFDE